MRSKITISFRYKVRNTKPGEEIYVNSFKANRNKPQPGLS